MPEKSLKKSNYCITFPVPIPTKAETEIYEGWNFNSGNYLFTTDTK